MNYIPNKLVKRNGKDCMRNVLEIDFDKGIISLVGEINDNMAMNVKSVLRSMNDMDEVYIYVMSEGGSVYSGLSIIDSIEQLKKKCDVNTIACGHVDSMAAIILASGTRGKRWCEPNARVLIHQPLSGVSGQVSDLKIHVENTIKTREKVNCILSEYTGQPRDKIELDTERDYIMSANEAKEYGIVDKIGDPYYENE